MAMIFKGRFRAPQIVAASCLLVCGSAIARAEQATPTPSPTPQVEENQKALAEAAKSKTLKGTESGKSIVITNENLADYASKGSLTTTTGKGESANSGRRPLTNPGNTAGMVEAPSGAVARTDERRRYWVGQYERQLQLIASIKIQIDRLDREIPGLWRDFYSWDDPSYRDGVIKPKLDQAIKRRERLESDLRREEPRLEEIKSNARQDGGEPGWFRGISPPTPLPEEPTPDIMPK